MRELRNIIEGAVALSTEKLAELEPLLREPEQHAARAAPYLTEMEFREWERQNVRAALEAAGWRVAAEGGAAELLGIPPSTLANRLRSLGIAKPNPAPYALLVPSSRSRATEEPYRAPRS